MTTVSERALSQRINRRLNKEDQHLTFWQGQYDVVNSNGWVAAIDVCLEDLANELGCLEEDEIIEPNLAGSYAS